MNAKFSSGLSGKIKSDCRVTFIPMETNGNKIELQSKLKSMFGKSIIELTKKTLNDLGIHNCVLQIDDFGALPFVIQARIEAAVKKAFPDLKNKSLPVLKEKFIYNSSKNKSRITRLYLPANQTKLMLNAGLHKPDALILDLEDSVTFDEKLSARLIARNALRVLNFYDAEKMVRINQGELGLQDLEEIVSENVNLILIPKVERAEELQKIDRNIKEISKECRRNEPVFLMPIIESALGIMNAFKIAKASENNVALAIGLEDYTADIGANRTVEGRESLFARSMIVNAAKAVGIQAIDSVFSDVVNEEGLYNSTLESKALGFDGKGCIHPSQIKIINKAFTPTDKEIKNARKIVEAFKEAEKKGLGVVSLGSKMIDPPVVKRALKIITEIEK